MKRCGLSARDARILSELEMHVASEQGRQVCSSLEDILKQISDDNKLLAGIIQDNEECRQSRHELERLFFALETYLETDPRLRYVGLVGSFSSGKTATINNLLELAGGHRRPEDINPVDERLTVCVHKLKIDSVIPALLKSTWQHDTFTHAANDLTNIILVDTPGGGDPKVRTDIVHNFLPICDTIIYCFNSTNPLNINDVPILQEMNQILRHTDFFYVYTRADNVFRLDENAPLAPENFDTKKAERQREAFFTRLGDALDGITVKTPELFFVSNAAPFFGLDELRKRLLSQVRDDTSLALKKIAFFRERSIETVAIILNVLRELRATVEGLVAKAELNHQQYNEKFEISTEDVKEFWKNAQTTIQTTTGRFKELETKHLAEAVELNSLMGKAINETDVQAHIRNFANTEIESLVRELGHLSKERFERWSGDIRERLILDGLPGQSEGSVREDLGISTRMVLPIGKFRKKFVEDAEAKCQKLANDVIQHSLRAIANQGKNIKSDFEKTGRHAAEGELFQIERDLREACRREISAAINLYAFQIDLYVAGINTAGTMMLIQKAKLGSDVDFLQNERIDDDEKRATSDKVIDELFGHEHQKLSAIETRCHLLPQELRSLTNEAAALAEQAERVITEMARRDPSQGSASAASLWDDTLRSIVTAYEAWLEQECEKVVAALVSKHQDIVTRFERQKEQVISSWKKRILWVGALGALIIFFGIAIYLRIGASPEQQSWGEVVVLGGAGSGLWAAIALVFEKISARRTAWIATSRAAFFRGETPNVISDLISRPQGPPPELTEERETCKSRTVVRLESLTSTNQRNQRSEVKRIADEIEAVRGKGQALVNDYRSAWEAARQIVEGLYRETDEKIGHFKGVSAAFKERTIDRTRTLFGDRAEQIAAHIASLELSVRKLREAP